jgi:hypothetical protein
MRNSLAAHARRPPRTEAVWLGSALRIRDPPRAPAAMAIPYSHVLVMWWLAAALHAVAAAAASATGNSHSGHSRNSRPHVLFIVGDDVVSSHLPAPLPEARSTS